MWHSISLDSIVFNSLQACTQGSNSAALITVQSYICLPPPSKMQCLANFQHQCKWANSKKRQSQCVRAAYIDYLATVKTPAQFTVIESLSQNIRYSDVCRATFVRSHNIKITGRSQWSKINSVGLPNKYFSHSRPDKARFKLDWQEESENHTRNPFRLSPKFF